MKIEQIIRSVFSYLHLTFRNFSMYQMKPLSTNEAKHEKLCKIHYQNIEFSFMSNENFIFSEFKNVSHLMCFLQSLEQTFHLKKMPFLNF